MVSNLSPAVCNDSNTVSVSIQDIPLKDIEIKENIRTGYEDIDALMVSIRQYGLLQPIMVYRDGEGYAVKTGHRRFLAYRSLYQEAPDRFHHIRCIISDDRNVATFQLIENLQRADLSQRDLFNALISLKEQGCSLKQIGDIMGTSEASVKVMFTGINEIKQDPSLLAFIGSPGGTIRDVVDTKGIPNKTERLDLLEQRKTGTITRAEMREKARELKAKTPEQTPESKKVFLTLNAETRSILLTFQADIPFALLERLKTFLTHENLICADTE